jgi:hypothetical protein
MSRLIKGMPVDCEPPKPLRPYVKAGRSLRKHEQEPDHTQANEAKYHHFDFSVSRYQRFRASHRFQVLEERIFVRAREAGCVEMACVALAGRGRIVAREFAPARFLFDG